MRRIWIVSVFVLVLGLAAGPAWAGDSPISVPNSVEQGEKLKVKAFDCESGPDWTAIVQVEIFDEETGERVGIRTREADEDGSTRVKIRITEGRYPPGRYVVVVTCIHQFDDGSEGIWYEEEDTFRVVAAS